jgi:hypothetical protein
MFRCHLQAWPPETEGEGDLDQIWARSCLLTGRHRTALPHNNIAPPNCFSDASLGRHLTFFRPNNQPGVTSRWNVSSTPVMEQSRAILTAGTPSLCGLADFRTDILDTTPDRSADNSTVTMSDRTSRRAHAYQRRPRSARPRIDDYAAFSDAANLETPAESQRRCRPDQTTGGND